MELNDEIIHKIKSTAPKDDRAKIEALLEANDKMPHYKETYDSLSAEGRKVLLKLLNEYGEENAVVGMKPKIPHRHKKDLEPANSREHPPREGARVVWSELTDEDLSQRRQHADRFSARDSGVTNPRDR